MTDLAVLARHWMRQTETDRGIRLDASDLALLNAIGVGQLILDETGRMQREQCLRRTIAPTSVANTGLVGMSDETVQSERHFGQSIGTTNQREGIDPSQRARRRSSPQKMRSTDCTLNESGAKPRARHAAEHLKAVGVTA
jgi:hypothetical protein